MNPALPVFIFRTIEVSCAAVRRISIVAINAVPDDPPMLRARFINPDTSLLSVCFTPTYENRINWNKQERQP